MTDHPTPNVEEFEALRTRLLQTERLVADHEATIAALSLELAETNRGVVALYAELDDNAVQLKDASDLKSRFLSYMSHEFRTPLGSILSIARLLLGRMDGPLTDEQHQQVTFIVASARELSEMVDDLLDLAKIEAGRITISPGWFDMVDLFSALRGMFKPILATTDVTLVFEEPHNIPPIYSDDRKLSQILRNFISNALKFTLQGEVRVTARLIDENHVQFSVADTGIGIPAEQMPALFRDYTQIDSSLQKRLKGTGLGLSLSRKLAVILGGEVSATSEVGIGSTFSVVVPLSVPGHEPPRFQ